MPDPHGPNIVLNLIISVCHAYNILLRKQIVSFIIYCDPFLLQKKLLLFFFFYIKNYYDHDAYIGTQTVLIVLPKSSVNSTCFYN
jgi:hypothetical protein